MLFLTHYQVKQQFTLVQQLMFGLDNVDAHQRGFMCEIDRSVSMATNGCIVFNEFINIPSSMRAMQRTQIHAKKCDKRPQAHYRYSQT